MIVKELALLVDGRDDMVIDLQNSSLEEIKQTTFTIKEGIKYRIRITFYVQREIVTGKADGSLLINRLTNLMSVLLRTGLKYVQKIIRKGIACESMNQMIGSYAPKPELQTFLSPVEGKKWIIQFILENIFI